MSKEEYLEKRRQLQQEYDSLRPVDYDELTEAADLLEHFQVYWDECANTPDLREARKQLVAKIVDLRCINDDEIIAIVLHGNFAVVLGENKTASTVRTHFIYTRTVCRYVRLLRPLCKRFSHTTGSTA